MLEKLEKIGEKGVLFDTDILIDYLRGNNYAKEFIPFVLKRFRVYLTLINIAEIYAGKEMKNLYKREIVEKFLNQFFILDFNTEIAKLAGDLKRDYQLGFSDAFIASTCLFFDFVLITRNIKDHQKITNLRIFSPY